MKCGVKLSIMAGIITLVLLHNGAAAPRTLPPEELEARKKELAAQRERASAAAADKLNGRAAIIRIYHNWQTDRWNYQSVAIRLRGNVLKFDMRIPQTSVAVLLRGDQTDAIVMDSVNCDAQLLAPGASVPLYPGRGKRTNCMTFLDTVGGPISLGTGEIYQRGPKPEEDKQVSTFILDEQGKTQWRYTSTKRTNYYLWIRHPYYGELQFSIPLDENEYTWRISKVRPDHEAYQRSIRGFVVDDANKPVPGVSLQTERIYPPGGGNVVYALGGTVTNESGFFHMYPMVHPDSRSKIGELIPPRTNYEVWVEPPAGLGLVGQSICILNNTEQTVRLRRGYFHTFSFEDGGERITSTDKLDAIRLYVETADGTTLTYLYRQITAGRFLPLGRYTASDWALRLNFDPIEVTQDSPEELVFRTKSTKKDKTVYSGYVVNGVTCVPMEGAFVFAVSGMSSGLGPNFCEFTQEQWKKLHSLPSRFSPDAKAMDKRIGDASLIEVGARLKNITELPPVEDALWPVHRLWNMTKGVRTDPNGRFEMEFGKNEKVYKLMFLEEGYLCLMQEYYSMNAEDANGNVNIGAMPLFPAAKVAVEVNMPAERARIIPQWIIEPNDCPEWVRRPEPPSLSQITLPQEPTALESELEFDFKDDPNRVRTLMEFDRGRWSDFVYNQDIPLRKKKIVHVPAGVRLKLHVRPLTDREHVWVPYTYPQTISLKQGETLDLGPCEILKTIHIFVKVIDIQGKPVEGIPIENPLAEQTERHNTDAQGKVRLSVYPHYKGNFTISCETHGTQAQMPFEVGGDKDIGREFIFPISEKVRQHFLN